MCGRFSSYDDDDDKQVTQMIVEATTLFSESDLPYTIKTKGEVFPTDVVPIILKDFSSKNFKLKAEFMYWGYPGFPNRTRPKAKPKPLINTKGETALTLRTWKDSTSHRRALVPTSGFYEWSHHDPKHKVKYLFKKPRSQSLFLGAIYKEFREDGDISFPHFSIITVTANLSMKDIHDRMPLIVLKDDFHTWLSDSDNFKEILTRNSVELVKEAQ